MSYNPMPLEDEEEDEENRQEPLENEYASEKFAKQPYNFIVRFFFFSKSHVAVKILLGMLLAAMFVLFYALVLLPVFFLLFLVLVCTGFAPVYEWIRKKQDQKKFFPKRPKSITFVELEDANYRVAVHFSKALKKALANPQPSDLEANRAPVIGNKSRSKSETNIAINQFPPSPSPPPPSLSTVLINGLGFSTIRLFQAMKKSLDASIKGCRIFSYDRGMGYSDPIPRSSKYYERSLSNMVEELHDLLSRLSLDSHPLVLVGASLGGSMSQLYALRYPQHIRGILFVDPTPEDLGLLPSSSIKMFSISHWNYRTMAWMSYLGLSRLLLDLKVFNVFKEIEELFTKILPTEARDYVVADFLRPSSLFYITRECEHFVPSLRRLHEEKKRILAERSDPILLRGVPIVILSSMSWPTYPYNETR